MILSLRSDTLPLDQVDNYADVILSQQVSRIDGVGLVTIGGQQKPAVRIQLDPRKIAARGLQIDAMRQAIVAATTNAPKGTIVGPQRNLTVYANDQILDAAPWNDLVVGYQNGAPVRIKDIGKAFASVENDQIGAWVYPGKGNTDPDHEGRTGHPAGDLQGARRQRHRHGEPDPRRAAGPAGQYSARHRHPYPDGPDPDHQRLGGGRESHAADHGRAGGAGDLPVPARHPRHPDPQRGDSAGAAGRRRGDVRAAISAWTICR